MKGTLICPGNETYQSPAAPVRPMTLASGLLRLLEERLDPQAASAAAEAVSRLLLPRRMDGRTVEGYVRKAMRLGVWRRLRHEARALLLALRGWGPVRSPTLREVLRRILLEIELAGLKGRALFYGALMALRGALRGLRELLARPAYLLALGISYLNTPPMYRVYG